MSKIKRSKSGWICHICSRRTSGDFLMQRTAQCMDNHRPHPRLLFVQLRSARPRSHVFCVYLTQAVVSVACISVWTTVVSPFLCVYNRGVPRSEGEVNGSQRGVERQVMATAECMRAPLPQCITWTDWSGKSSSSAISGFAVEILLYLSRYYR